MLGLRWKRIRVHRDMPAFSTEDGGSPLRSCETTASTWSSDMETSLAGTRFARREQRPVFQRLNVLERTQLSEMGQPPKHAPLGASYGDSADTTRASHLQLSELHGRFELPQQSNTGANAADTSPATSFTCSDPDAISGGRRFARPAQRPGVTRHELREALHLRQVLWAAQRASKEAIIGGAGTPACRSH
ncbi:uncharacterized protein LOC144105015 [Amblyomma americanum]